MRIKVEQGEISRAVTAKLLYSHARAGARGKGSRNRKTDLALQVIARCGEWAGKPRTLLFVSIRKLASKPREGKITGES